MKLETKNLTFSFMNNANVLKNVAAQIPSQKLTAIMGLNGSGKSTLLRLLSGFYSPHAGDVFLDSKNLNLFSRKELAQKITLVPQDFPTEFAFSVFEFVMMGRFPWKNSFLDSSQDITFVKSILKDCELESLSTRKINSLSGGERQRVLMARALAQDTPTLLLDEPFNHLDIKHRIAFIKLLKNLITQQNKTLVAVIHDLNLAKEHFDHVILLHNQEVVFSGAFADAWQSQIFETVFETPQSDLLAS